MPKKKGGKLPDPKLWQECHHDACKDWALFLEDVCWRHLSPKKKKAYKSKIENWVKKGNSLEEANFNFADLKGIDLNRVNLRRASMMGADLKGTSMVGVILREANLIGSNLEDVIFSGLLKFPWGASEIYADLTGANLWGANLRNANLRRVDLQRTIFFKANLQGVNLTSTNLQKVNLSEANLREVNFENVRLQEAFLSGVLLTEARHLSWDKVGKVGEEKEKRWIYAADAYNRLKNHFHQQGRYEDEIRAYYREKLMTKHRWHEKLCGPRPTKEYRKRLRQNKLLHTLIKQGNHKGLRWMARVLLLFCIIKRGGENIKRFFSYKNYNIFPEPYVPRFKSRIRWLGLWIFHVFTGFGERWWWTVLWALGVIAFFAVIYGIGHATGAFLFDFKPTMIPSIFQYFYLSVVTFATLGFGDITPLNWQAQIPVVIEVIMGYVFLGLIITIIARRFGR